jgi:hypothetical protein
MPDFDLCQKERRSYHMGLVLPGKSATQFHVLKEMVLLGIVSFIQFEGPKRIRSCPYRPIQSLPSL